MKGIPAALNTKADVETCVRLALAGDLDGTKLKEKLKALMSDEKVWMVIGEVVQAYAPAEDEKVMVDPDPVTGTTKYVLYRLTDNPDARYLKMGFSKSELQALIAQL